MPTEIIREISNSHEIKRVLWAAIGDVAESWFYALEYQNGAVILRLGQDAPEAVQDWIDQIPKSSERLKNTRVQLGYNGSFVVWSLSLWACHNVPPLVRMHLCSLSSHSRQHRGVTKGVFK
jgi:hypothetical protein